MANYLNITRCYATAASGVLIKPPIPFFGTGGKYTNALYSAATKSKKSEKVEEDLKTLKDLCKNDSRFKDFLGDPLVKQPLKAKALQDISSKIKLCDVTANLVQLMAENNRLVLLPQVADNFCKIMSVTRGEIDCTVISAKPITDPNVRKELEATIKKFTNKKITIKSQVDPSIMGGLVIDFGGEYYIDMSLRNKMKLYTDMLKESV